MSDRSVVLITPEDPVTSSAIGYLTEWVRHGLIHPFISCIYGDGVVAVSRRGVDEVSTVFEFLARADLEMVRVVGLLGPDADGAEEVARRTGDMVDSIKKLAPPGLSILQARIWSPEYPYEGQSWQAPEGFFTTEANANLIVLAEDRPTESNLAVPLVAAESDSFASHLATELATALGMWSSMSVGPVDEMEGGTIGYGKAKIHLVRSFIRVAEIPAVTLAGAADHGGMLRVPSGCQEAPYPRETLADAQRRIESLLRAELVDEKPTDRPKKIGITELVRVMGRGVLNSLRYMFTISQDVIDALRDMTGRIMQDAIGHDSVLRVVWRDMPSGRQEDEKIVDTEALMQTVRRRRSLEGGVRIDQQLWVDVGRAVFSLTDGGQMPGEIKPLKIRDRVVIVKEVRMIAPPYGPDLAAEIRADAEADVPSTMLGRLGAYIRGLEASTRREFDRLVDLSKKVLEVEPLPALTPGGMVASVLITLALAGLLVLSGIVELIGITAMGSLARAWIWGTVTTVYAAALVTVTGAGVTRLGSERTVPSRPSDSAGDESDTHNDVSIDTSKQRVVRDVEDEGTRIESPSVKSVATLAVLAGLGAGLISSMSGLSGLDALAFGISVTLAVYAIALAVQLDRRSRHSPETFRQVRLLFFLTVIYAAFGLVGLLARDRGWYGDRRLEDLGYLWKAEAIILFLILLFLLAMALDSFRRDNRARTRISDLERGIVAAVDTQWAAEEAYEQFLGSAAAWAAVLWKPFGEFDPGEGDMRDELLLDVLKADTQPFVVTALGATAIRERMMKELASPGWVRGRYETAIDAYRRRRAIETGSEASAVLRPDQDPREVHTILPEERPDVSGRWRFMRDLISGTYNRDLSRALAASDHASAAEWAYRQEDTIEASETGGESLEQYLQAVVSRSDSKASYVYFDPAALGEADRSLRTRLWWPSTLIDPPAGRDVEASDIRGLSNGDLAILSVRHDLAGPYTPADLLREGPEETLTSRDQELLEQPAL